MNPTILEHLHRRIPGLIAVYQFGSQVRGSVRPESDVDIAVLAREPMTSSARFDIAQDLAVTLHRDVDLIDLQATSTVMRMQVLSNGICLDSLDDQARRTFEMYAYADYARLNEERRDIVKGIAARGLVYG